MLTFEIMQPAEDVGGRGLLCTLDLLRLPGSGADGWCTLHDLIKINEDINNVLLLWHNACMETMTMQTSSYTAIY